MEIREKIQAEITDKILYNKKGIYHVGPRVGKTRCVINFLKYFDTKKRVLISVPYETVITNWKKEFEKWNPANNHDITYVCHSSLDKYSRTDEKYDIVIIDEIHKALSFTRLNAMRRLNSDRLVGLSGSLGEKHIRLLETNLNIKVLYEYTVDDSVKDEIVKDYEIHIHRVPLNTSDSYVKQYKKSKINYTEEEMNTILSSEVKKALDEGNNTKIKFTALARARFLYNTRSKNKKAIQLINGHTGRCIIFTQLSVVADTVCSNSYHSKSSSDSLELFLEEKIQKISVVNLVDMGITFPNLNRAILVSIQSSEDKAIQRILRTMTRDEKHSKARIDIIINKDTKEESWCEKALKSFDRSKITYHNE